jgi:citrate lyase subunit beta / citryl-CoA lyase
MLMRSKLFVPGSRPELFAKAAASAADALSFDLEDAVAIERKADARAAVAAFLSAAAAHRKVNIVRVNAVGTELFAADMEAIGPTHVDVVNLPMVEDVSAIRETARALDRLERDGDAKRIRLLVNIESPKGLRMAHELASSHPRVMGLQIGYADLFEPYGIDRVDPIVLSHVRLAVRLAAAEARVEAYDGAFANVQDRDGYRAECEAARRQGFAGKSCIHPDQVAIANQTFMPQPGEIAKARRIVSAAADAQARGIGAFVVDGQMIDKPFLESARAVIALADLQAAQAKEP